MARFQMSYGDVHHARGHYCVWDNDRKEVVYTSNSKTETIAMAQRCNGWQPADGSETTYIRQMRLSK